ncbi:hypothetical protein COP2_002558 [Malus domestica]
MEEDRDRTWRCSWYGRRLRLNLEMQLLRERMRGKATGKGSSREKRWDEDEEELSQTPQKVGLWWREL